MPLKVLNQTLNQARPCWPPPPEYLEARADVVAVADRSLDGLPEPHKRAIERARGEHPGRAEELRALFRILDVGRRMDSLYRRRWST